MDYQEQVVQIAYRGMEFSAREMLLLMRHVLEKRNAVENKIVHGEQSLKKLNEQNRALEKIQIDRADLKAVKRELNKNSVDFAVRKDPDSGEYRLYFKAQDVDRVYDGLSACIKKFDSRPQRTPMSEQLTAAAEKAAELNASHQAESLAKQKDRVQSI